MELSSAADIEVWNYRGQTVITKLKKKKLLKTIESGMGEEYNVCEDDVLSNKIICLEAETIGSVFIGEETLKSTVASACLQQFCDFEDFEESDECHLSELIENKISESGYFSGGSWFKDLFFSGEGGYVMKYGLAHFLIKYGECLKEDFVDEIKESYNSHFCDDIFDLVAKYSYYDVIEEQFINIIGNELRSDVSFTLGILKDLKAQVMIN